MSQKDAKNLMKELLSGAANIHNRPDYPSILQQNVEFYCAPEFAYYWSEEFNRDHKDELKQNALLWFISKANEIIFSENKILKDGIVCSIDSQFSSNSTKTYREADLSEIPEPKYGKTKSSVNYHYDYLETFKHFNDKEGNKVAVVSLAGEDQPGGNFQYGGLSQEADIYRRSFMEFQLKKEWPLDPSTENFGFFSKNVLFFRSSMKDGYSILSDAPLLDIITMPFPDKENNNMNKEDYISAIGNKIEMIFRIAIINNVTHLVFGSFGAQSHNTPVELFKEVLLEKLSEYAGYFKWVVVAFGGAYECTLKMEFLKEALKGLGYKKNNEVFYPEKLRLCYYNGLCTGEISANHLKEELHPSICPDLMTCTDNTSQHLLEFWHNPDNIPCKYGFQCLLPIPKNKRNEHTRMYTHPFLPICKYEPLCQKKEDKKHRELFSHICRESFDCKHYKNKNETHLRILVHLKQESCPEQDSCTNEEYVHFVKFYHKNLKPFNENCPQIDTCSNWDRVHRVNYIHHPPPPAICNVRGYNSNIDMRKNMEEMKGVVFQFLSDNGLLDKAKSPEIINFIKSLHPQHRCHLDTFQKVLAHGALMSRFKLAEFETNRKDIIISHIDANTVINKILSEKHLKGVYMFTKWVDEFVDELIGIKELSGQLPNKLIGVLGNDDFETIKKEISHISAISKQVQLTGIGHHVDLELGTNKFIFCTVGPNRKIPESDYGDIIIILSPKLMYHPDFNMTPIAGTSFMNKPDSPGYTNNFAKRPWSKSQCPPDLAGSSYSKESLKALFHKSKISAAVPGWVEFFGAELVAKTYCKKKDGNPLEYHNHVNSHFTFEGHMPELISFSYVEKIAMPTLIWNKLNKEEKDRLDALLGGQDKLILFDCSADEFIKAMAKIDFFKAIRHDSCEGFEFSIEKRYGSSFALPVKMRAKPDKPYKIQFEAKGWDIHLSFSKSAENTKNSPKSKEFLHLVIYNFYSYRADPKYSVPRITLAGSHRVKDKQFSKQDFIGRIEIPETDKSEQNEYTILIHYNDDEIKITVSKTNLIEDLMVSSAMSVGGSFQIDKTSPYFIKFGEIEYLHFSCWDKPVQVKNLRID